MNAFTALWLSALDAKYLTWKLILVIMAKVPLKRLPQVWSHSYDFPRGHWMQSDCHQWFFLHCTDYRLVWVGITYANLSILFFSDSLWLLMDSLSLKKVSLLLRQVVTFKLFSFQSVCLHKRAFSIQFISFRSWTRMFKICGQKPLNIYLGHYAPPVLFVGTICFS